ncbi:MAG: GTP-binding protein [Planctomycetota bacterium JB042]
MTARYVMIGGFLGAGKTTAILRYADRLRRQGRTVGLITNDQSTGLVDTALVRARGFAVEEITGGCFCCRFPSLKAAADQLTAATRPDVFLAEPVGSCTDLVATVGYPLRRLYGDAYEVSPLSVLVDPLRAARVLGLRDGRAFSEKVRYVFEKQLEEAHLLVVNKADALDPALAGELDAALGERFPRARRFRVSARTGDGLDAWFDAIESTPLPHDRAMDVDYDRYAEGEALLGWLNATLRVTAPRPFDANAWLERLAERLVARLLAEGDADIAHFKATLDPGDPLGGLAAVSVVRNEERPALRERLDGDVEGGTLVLNLRVETDPEELRRALDATLDEAAAADDGVRLELEHREAFRPGRPVPTHRLETPS